ncbi:MAG: hypothetical protein RLZZ362_2218 [Actinomycetota bacterium]
MHLVGTAAFKAVETSDPRLAGSIPVHLRHMLTGRFGHRVRITTRSTYRKQWRLIAAELGSTPVRRPTSRPARSTYADGEGMVLGPTKTRGTAGRQLLGPSVVQLLTRRRELQALDWERTGGWPQAEYEGVGPDGARFLSLRVRVAPRGCACSARSREAMRSRPATSTSSSMSKKAGTSSTWAVS